MTNLYHEDIYKFEKPVKSYWESTIDTNNNYKTLDTDINTNVVVIDRLFYKYFKIFRL